MAFEAKRPLKLLKRKSAPKKITKADWKPIMDAAYVGDAKRVGKLLKADADPNVVSGTAHRYRPLLRAIEHKKTAPKHAGHDAVVKILLKHDADPALRGTLSNLNALQLAAMHEPRFVPMLVEYFQPLDIFNAALLGEVARVKRLLAGDKSLATARNERGFTPLHCCAASALYRLNSRQSDALVRIARMLLDAGADPNGTYLYGGKWPISVLYHCSGQHNHPALTELLLEAGADPCDYESVYHASDEGHQECLDLFAKHVDPKRLAAEASMCLANQLQWGRVRGMPWLLAHGADPNFKNREGKTTIQLARAAGKTSIVQQLEAAGRVMKMPNT